MAHLWIVHRDLRWRESLRHLAGAIEMEVGGPGDLARFERAARPRAVLLGVAGDFEAELEFAHRFAPRLGATLWVLLVRSRDRAEVARLFDALPATLVAVSSDAAALRGALAAALAQRPALPGLALRSQRDEIARRFALWTEDLDPRELLAATDPARRELPLLVRGEAGTGRRLVARYLAQVTRNDARDAWVVWRGEAFPDPAGERAGGGTLAICIEDADRLDPETQLRIRDAIEHGLPQRGALHAAQVRWMATVGAGDDALDPSLAHALAGHEIRLPPLRERAAAIDALVGATRRRFVPEALAHLHAHPWPGNLRELDAVLRRTLAATSADPIPLEALGFDRATIVDPEDLDLPLAAPATTPPEQAAPIDPASTSIHRLSSAIAHEVGNPLLGIRTFASLLPTRFDDPEFRAQFRERVEEDTRRIESVIETLAELGGLEAPARSPVDASALLAGVLADARLQIRERRQIVLEDLDRERPLVLGDAAQLRFALAVLLHGALDWIPPQGDLYVSTRHRAGVLRIELRMRGAGGGLGFESQSLAVAVAEAVVRAHGGSLVGDAGPEGATRIEIELPAPA